MSIFKDDLVWKIRILGNDKKHVVGVVLRNVYEDVIKISENPPISEIVLCVDLLVENKIYKKVPINQLEKLRSP